MLASARVPLGAPGIYPLPDYARPRLDPQRMDVCAFVGVAPRGPAYEPVVDQAWPSGYRMASDLARPRRRSVAVAIESFDDYRRVFGGFEAPGLLPYAVASFFEQGGRRAYVVRIVHAQAPQPPGSPAGLANMATGVLQDVFTSPIAFRARNAGEWGNALRVEMGFTSREIPFTTSASGTSMFVDDARALCAGAWLALTDRIGGVTRLALCRGLDEVRDPHKPQSKWRVVLDQPLVTAPGRAAVVEAWIEIRDGAGNAESFRGLGLSPDHPNALAAVLCDQSTLLWPDHTWAALDLEPATAALATLRGTCDAFSGGSDDYGAITPSDFFDIAWSPTSDDPGSGIAALAGIEEVTHLVVPDLYQPAAIDDTGLDPDEPSGGTFMPCVVVTPPAAAATPKPPSALANLVIDPRRDLDDIVALQNRIVEFCEATQAVIALIDVPPRLSQGQIERWRGNFDSTYCAAYHPWLAPSRRAFDRGDARTSALRRLVPSAVAAGIIARKELRNGIQWGPANEIATEIVDLGEPVPANRADVFHPQGINCFVRECDGIHLVSARTLSRDPQWRQLSVRRLMLMLRRTLLRETQWAVFEPNGPALWRDLQHAIENFLRRLYRNGAFVGDSEAEAFFVRVHRDTPLLDRGLLLIDIGVAPAEPLEYILLRLRRDGDGLLTIEE